MAKNDERHERIIKALINKIEANLGHESDAAQRVLENLCKKHNIDIDEVMNQKTKRTQREYSYKSINQDILHQIMLRYGGNDKVLINKRFKILITDLTDSEHLEVTHAIDVLVPLYKKELKKIQQIAINAFVQKHDLFFKGETDESDLRIGKEKEKSAAEQREEMRRQIQIGQMAEGMQDAEILKRLS